MESPEFGYDNVEATHSRELVAALCLNEALNANARGEISVQDVIQVGTVLENNEHGRDCVSCEKCGAAVTLIHNGVGVITEADVPGKPSVLDCPDRN